MILLPRAVRVYFATAPVSLRKSFDGLSNEVREVLKRDPLSGHVFVFLNRRKTQAKLLIWTRGGFTIVHKRLESGNFTFLARVRDDVACVPIDVHELSMLLEGIDVSRARSSRRWEPPAHASRWRREHTTFTPRSWRRSARRRRRASDAVACSTCCRSCSTSAATTRSCRW
jgi:transposase